MAVTRTENFTRGYRRPPSDLIHPAVIQEGGLQGLIAKVVRPEQAHRSGRIKARLFPAGRSSDQKVGQSLDGCGQVSRIFPAAEYQAGIHPAQAQVQAEGEEGVGQQGLGHIAGPNRDNGCSRVRTVHEVGQGLAVVVGGLQTLLIGVGRRMETRRSRADRIQVALGLIQIGRPSRA